MEGKKKEEVLRRNHRITVRLTNQELENLRIQAKRMSVSDSEYIRRCLSEKPIEVLYRLEVESEQMKKFVHELGAISVNLNQIARYYNTGGNRALVMDDIIHEAIYQLFELRKEILRFGDGIVIGVSQDELKERRGGK